MDQQFIEKIFDNYDHLKGKYLGCFFKDEMKRLQKAILYRSSMHERLFALINTLSKDSSGEHWMGLVINMRTQHARYFNSFGRHFKWLSSAREQIRPNKFHRTKYKGNLHVDCIPYIL